MTVNPKSNISKKKVKIELLKSEFFKQFYAVGAMGGHSPYDFRIGFYNDSPKATHNSSDMHIIQRMLESEVILSPLAALELATWLNQHIKDYEATFGPIHKIQRVYSPIKNKTSKDSSDIQGYI